LERFYLQKPAARDPGDREQLTVTGGGGQVRLRKDRSW
jgi:hypothetical protein